MVENASRRFFESLFGGSLRPDEVASLVAGLQQLFRVPVEANKEIASIDFKPLFDGRSTRHNVIRAADGAIEDPKISDDEKDLIRFLRANFIEGFDRITSDGSLAAAAVMAVRTAFLLGTTDAGREMGPEVRNRFRKELVEVHAKAMRDKKQKKGADERECRRAAVRKVMRETKMKIKYAKSIEYAARIRPAILNQLGNSATAKSPSAATILRDVRAILKERPEESGQS